jgi:hypothetical protein
MKNLQTYENYITEGNRTPSEEDAKQFISEVLKLGDRSNLFDAYMKKHGLNPNDLYTFVHMVADQIKTKWQ